jgi:hypothetical protein
MGFIFFVAALVEIWGKIVGFSSRRMAIFPCFSFVAEGASIENRYPCHKEAI